MAKLTLLRRSTGMIITFQWSRQGDWQLRRQAWGQHAALHWSATKLGGSSDGFGLWELPASVTFEEVNEWLSKHLTQADRVAVVFPHGSVNGASAISVHTHNIQPD